LCGLFVAAVIANEAGVDWGSRFGCSVAAGFAPWSGMEGRRAGASGKKI
jgi:hypothetical protein